VLYTDTIYPVLSEEDETEIENLNTLRRLQFDKNDCITQMNTQRVGRGSCRSSKKETKT
jgi:hypothetical protein